MFYRVVAALAVVFFLPALLYIATDRSLSSPGHFIPSAASSHAHPASAWDDGVVVARHSLAAGGNTTAGNSSTPTSTGNTTTLSSAALTDYTVDGGPCSLSKVYPVKCANSTYCCLNGTHCYVNASGWPSCRYTCPKNTPVDCGDGSCCPRGYNCSAYRTCTRPPVASQAGKCATNFSLCATEFGSFCCASNNSNCSHPASNLSATVCQAPGWGCSDSYPVHCLAQGQCCPKGHTCLKFGGCGSCDHEPKLKTFCHDNSKMWCCDWTASCGPNASLPCIQGCFDADSLVRVRRPSDGAIVSTPLRRVAVGDYVESVDDSGSAPTFSRVYFVAHDGSEALAQQLEIKYAGPDRAANLLRITPRHLLYAAKTSGDFALLPAESVAPGDWILVASSASSPARPALVLGVGKRLGPVRHPLTASGRIVVSSVVCSVHAGSEPAFWLITSPLRLLDQLIPGVAANPLLSALLNVCVNIVESVEQALLSVQVDLVSRSIY